MLYFNSTDNSKINILSALISKHVLSSGCVAFDIKPLLYAQITIFSQLSLCTLHTCLFDPADIIKMHTVAFSSFSIFLRHIALPLIT